MKYEILYFGFLLFFSCLMIHILIWRIRIPWVSSLVLLVLFLALPAAGFLTLVADVYGVRTALQIDLSSAAEVLALHLSLSCAYIASYPAARAVSPSLDIIRMIASSEKRKMTEREILQRYTETKLVKSRIEDLTSYRFIRESDSVFRLNRVGNATIQVFILYRKVLGLPMGGG